MCAIQTAKVSIMKTVGVGKGVPSVDNRIGIVRDAAPIAFGEVHDNIGASNIEEPFTVFNRSCSVHVTYGNEREAWDGG
jgi:hypothetical protein